MDADKKQVIDRVSKANNVLITVSTNPTVDQLAAAIGMTLFLNKLGKHATAVYSGETPEVISFLEPEKTLEKTTDSLQDFIIALDKSKADKLRYKVEDKVVKIFITPYKTSLSESDFEFSRGDFNVDVVLALGVQEQQDIDGAIAAHGRILHDATVISISDRATSSLGSIHWQSDTASSLCEMAVDLAETLKAGTLDAQMATSFLTGIVAETDRFKNDKTSPQTMAVSGKLMAAGANQQLVADELEDTEEAEPIREPKEEEKPTEIVADKLNSDAAPAPVPTKIEEDGTLEVEHEEVPKPKKDGDDILIDSEGRFQRLDKLPAEEEVTGQEKPTAEEPKPSAPNGSMNHRIEPLGPQTPFTAQTPASRPEESAAPVDLPPVNPPILKHDNGQPAAASRGGTDPAPTPTLKDIEDSITTQAKAAEASIPEPKADEPAPADTDKIEAARNAVEEAVKASNTQPLEPIKALNAQPIDLDLGPVPPGGELADDPMLTQVPPNSAETGDLGQDTPGQESTDEPKQERPAPPSSPPPLMPPPYTPPSQQNQQNSNAATSLNPFSKF